MRFYRARGRFYYLNELEPEVKIDIPFFTRKDRNEKSISILVASSTPNPEVLQTLASQNGFLLREAFTTKGVLQELPGVNLVICDSVHP